MIKIVLIHLVLIVTYCEPQYFLRECVVRRDKINRLYIFTGFCGSDGRTYRNMEVLKCVQETEYGKRVNLQLSYKGTCFGDLEWEQIYYTFLPWVIFSLFLCILIGVCWCSYRAIRACIQSVWKKEKHTLKIMIP